MKTAIEKNTAKKTRTSRRKVQPTAKAAVPLKSEIATDEGGFERVAIDLVDISPLNYRRFYNQADLVRFSEVLAVQGITAPVTLRKMETGRYELVVGERRYRAALLAGLTHLPAMVRVFTDAQVKEIQLTENLQRENPHPMHEAFAVSDMRSEGHNIEEIAARLGKSKAFVFNRLKLVELIAPFQEIFLSNKMTLTQASQLAALDHTAQQEILEEECPGWEEEEFQLDDLRYTIRKYQYNLFKAPFDLADKSLSPDMGACTGCSFNSASLATLFPEMAEKAICSNHTCYNNKSMVAVRLKLMELLTADQPEAIIVSARIPENLKGLLESMEITRDLPQYDFYDVSIQRPPTLPDRADYEDEGEEGEEFDGVGYNEALEEFKADMDAFELLKEVGTTRKGLWVQWDGSFSIVAFDPDKPKSNGRGKEVTAKEVQEAIKAGTVTTELLEGEIKRLNVREARSMEKDSEKIQETVHSQFMERFSEIGNVVSLTAADQMAARLLIFQSLNYTVYRQVEESLFGEQEPETYEEKLQALASMTDQQYSYLIRMAVASKPESKSPRQIIGLCLQQLASDADIDVPAIVQAQDELAAGRKDKVELRVADMERRIKKLTDKA
ncbi:MAG TPA: ParB/RepB/Spo0J family partition protein [Pseudosphingobacterium sp.]|nr:ParB/RepB/Spo0J family partition protein [Pseudosphingobacterium sp.]